MRDAELSGMLNNLFYSGESLRLPEWSEIISDRQVEAIRQVEHLRTGLYAGIDPRGALDFYARRYLRQLPDFIKLEPETIVADIGTGYGWLPIAAALCGVGGKIIAVDPEEPRLMAGKEIAGILGVAEKIDWRVGSLGSLPLEDREGDIVFCVEVLEHVRRDLQALPDLARVCRELLIVTTPNQWFPVVAHDTRLPFCHWLPIPLRRLYARAFGRHKGEVDNLFWSPRSLEKGLPGFKRVSDFMHCASRKNYLETFPCYLPYGAGGGRQQKGVGALKGAYYGVAALAGKRSHWVLPTLAGTYRRQRAV
jgi:SAM-dependent methyltransferase